MGNQGISGTESSLSLCQLKADEDLSAKSNRSLSQPYQQIQKISQQPQPYSQFIQVQNISKNNSKQSNHRQRSRLLCTKQANNQPQSYYHFHKKEIKSSTKRIKRIQLPQKNTEQQKNIRSRQQEMFQQRILKSYRFFKSLKTLQLFESTFNLSFPILILNKSKSVTSLRKQIHLQKQKHTYFATQIQNAQQNCSNNVDINKNVQSIEQKYLLFQVLEKLEKNITRIFETGRHEKVIKQILNLDNFIGTDPSHFNIKKLQKFIDKLNQTNFQFLDMLYYQLSSPQIHTLSEQTDSEFYQNKKASLPLLDVKQFMINQQSKQNQDQSYQKLKQLGLELYTQNKVCFYILAGKNQPFLSQDNTQYNLQNSIQQKYLQSLEFHPLNLPKKPVLLQILLERYNAFAQLLDLNEITIIILANESKIQKINQLMVQNMNKWAKLNLIVLKQAEMPCLSMEGNILLTQNNLKDKQIIKASTGTGDLWDLLKQDQNEEGLKYLIERQFEYIEVIGAQNSLQHCFDCFMLGYIKSQELEWGTKVVQPCTQLTQLTLKKVQQNKVNNFRLNDLVENKKFKNSTKQYNESSLFVPYNRIKLDNFSKQTILYKDEANQLKVINQNEENYTDKIKQLLVNGKQFHTFTNHSIFCINFVKNKIKDPAWNQQVSFKKKIIQNQSKNKKIIAFEKDLTDIFTSSTNKYKNSLQFTKNSQQKEESTVNDAFMLFKYERDSEYYPLLFKQNEGVFDIEGASRALSMKSLSYLDLSIQKYLSSEHQFEKDNFLKCYIDPHISLQGEDMEEIKLEIERRLNQVLVSRNTINESNTMQTNKIKLNKSYRWQQYKLEESCIDLLKDELPSRVVSSVTQICVYLERFQKESPPFDQQDETSFEQLEQRINIFIN